MLRRASSASVARMAQRRNPRSFLARPATAASAAALRHTLRTRRSRCRLTSSQSGKSPVARTLPFSRCEANRSAVRSRLRTGTVVVRDALLGERSSGPRQRHGDGAQCEAAGQRQAKHKLGRARISLSSSCSFSIVLSCPAEMSRQDQYCNAQSFERSVKSVPIKCREISTIKTIFGFAQVRLHRTIPMRAPGDAENAFADRSWSRRFVKSARRRRSMPTAA